MNLYSQNLHAPRFPTRARRPARLILSTGALVHNVTTIRSTLAPSTGIIAMVKANAYGHGIVWAAKHMASRVEAFGVASLDEALFLRESGITAPIWLAEGAFSPQDVSLALAKNLSLVVHSKHQIPWIEPHLGTFLKASCPCATGIFPALWIKIDTGMGRLGLPPQEALPLVRRWRAVAKSLQNVQKKTETSAGGVSQKYPSACALGVLSHCAVAEEALNPLHLRQQETFLHFLKILKNDEHGENPSCPIITSFCNSAAIITTPSLCGDFVRPGLALYGIDPMDVEHACPQERTSLSKICGYPLPLRPVMKVFSQIIAINTYSRGHSVGYGGHFLCQKDTTIAIVAFGYGDGYPMAAGNIGAVLWEKSLCPVIGRVSMDMLAIDVSGLGAQVGDDVCLWGKEPLGARALAKMCNISPYILTTNMHARVFRQEDA